MTWYQISSCTSSVEVENTFLGSSGDRVMFSIELDDEVHNAIISDCSVYPAEDEVILEPNTVLEVSSVYDGGSGLTVVQMKQLRPLDPIIRYLFSQVIFIHVSFLNDR